MNVIPIETASDHSDIEGRVRALKDALKRRKMEADRLRKQQKRLNREKLKAQEASLKKQLEVSPIPLPSCFRDANRPGFAVFCYGRMTYSTVLRQLNICYGFKRQTPDIYFSVIRSRMLPHLNIFYTEPNVSAIHFRR